MLGGLPYLERMMLNFSKFLFRFAICICFVACSEQADLRSVNVALQLKNDSLQLKINEQKNQLDVLEKRLQSCWVEAAHQNTLYEQEKNKVK